MVRLRSFAERPIAVPISVGQTELAGGRLSPVQRLMLVREVLTVYCRVRWRLNRNELPSLVAQLRDERAGAPEPSGNSVEHIAERLGFVVHRVIRLIPTPGSCLVQSLVLTSLLAKHGIDGRLVIGVQAEPDFAAHAWVEHRGHTLLPAGVIYRRLVEL